MITIQTQSDGVLFNFQDSTRYLYGDGSILTPYNSLTLIADESNVLTFRKSASNDIFITAGYDELGYSSKEEAINDLKTKLFKATGGGGSESGITSGDVQTMIDNSLEDYYTDDEVDAALSGKASASDVAALQNEVAAKADTSAVTAVANDVSTLSGQVATKVNTTDFSAYSAATDARIAEDEEVTAAALNDLDENKQDALEYYSENTSGKTATIHIEDTENGTQSEVVVDSASVDMYAQSNFEEEGSAIETHTDIWGNSDGIAMTYEKNIDDAEAAHCYFNVNEGLISMEVMANEETTNVDVTSTGVTINGDAVATEPYVDAATSGKADTSAVTAVQQSLSGKQDTLVSGTNIKTINNESILGSGNITISGGGGQSLVYYTEDTSNESATIMVQNDDGLGNRSDNRVFVDGGDIIIESYNETDDGEGNTGTTDTQVDINSLGLSIITSSDDGIDTNQTELEVQPMGAYINSEPIATEPYVDAALSGKADTSAVTAVSDALTAHTSDTGIHVTQADKTSWNAKQDALSAGTGIEISGNVISATGGGGATYSAGTNISIDTANTINCTLPITANSATSSTFIAGNPSSVVNENILIGSTSLFRSNYKNNVVIGNLGTKASQDCVVIGRQATGGTNNNYDWNNIAIGSVANANGGNHVAIGFAVSATGTTKMNLNNQIKVDTNNQVYIKDKTNTTDVCIQDAIAALGGLKLVKLTQSEYDQLATKDPDTLYIITNVVS